MDISKLFSGLAIFLIIAGILLFLLARVPFFGRLPGDIFINRGNFTFFFPLVSSILLSIILTVLINLFLRR